ncbi:MAG: hypothetical protein ACFFE8_07655 [Candidatus Heimdallarchaeota archaeon]
MGFFKKIKSAVEEKVSVDAINPEIKQKIERSVLMQIDGYSGHYREEFHNVVQEWSDEGREIVFKHVDLEAHKRAGVETLKDKISEIVWNDIEDDVEENVKQKTDNEIAMKAAKKAGEKIVEVTVSKLVDEGLEKISKESEEEYQGQTG